MKKWIIISIIAAIIIAGLGVGWMYRVKIRLIAEDIIRGPMPEAQAPEDFIYNQGGEGSGGNVLPNALTLTKEEELPDSFNLDVPFTSQSPFKKWDEAHQELCEEAAALMVHYFFEGKKFSGPAEADEELFKLRDFQIETIGFYESTSAEELAGVIDEYWGYDVDLIYDFSIENVKRALYEGYPVIVPTAGRILDNPYFRDPGPVYHMIVIKGWKGDSFITHDPGTGHGADWVYTYDHVMNSAHDYNAGDTENGPRVIMILKPR